MSLIRVGLSETKDFAEGYDAIFKKKAAPAEAEKPQPTATGEKPVEKELPVNPFRKGDGIGC